MDLDELKSQLKHKLATDHAERSAEDIAQLLQKRTLSIVGKLKRSLLFEIRFGIVSILVFIAVVLFSDQMVLRIYFAAFTVLLAVAVAFLVYLFKRTSALSEGELPVKANLQAIANLIREFVKRCFQLAMALVPIGVAFMVLLQYYYGEVSIHSGAQNRFLSTPSRVAIFIVVYSAVFMVFMYYFTRWYLNKLYGRYLAQLNDCVEELDQS